MRFFCFQVVEHYLKTGYKSSSIADHNAVKAMLAGWLEQQVMVVCVHSPDEKGSPLPPLPSVHC